MPKHVVFGSEARKAMKRGVDVLANAVKATLGPKGRNVVIQQTHGSQTVTKDGVTVARQIDLPDPLENLGATLIKEAASKTNDDAGDGTTTSTILAQAIVEEGLKLVDAGVDPLSLRRGAEEAVKALVGKIAEMATKVSGDDIRHVASISANDKVIGDLIGDAMEKVGDHGVITVEDGNVFGVEVEVVDGLEFEKGYLSPHMIMNQETQESELNEPYIVITTEKIRAATELIPMAETLLKNGFKELLLIAPDVEGDALGTLVINKLRGTLSCVAVKAPGYGDRQKEKLEDIASVVGATVIDPDKGLKFTDIKLEHMGRAHKVIVGRDFTTIVGGYGDEKVIAERRSMLEARLQDTESPFERDQITERIACISGGVAVMKVGAPSDVELKEIRHRVEDAIAATKAAVEEGILPGGGTALLNARAILEREERGVELTDDEVLGYRMIMKAIEAPFRQLATNAGKDAGAVLAEVMRGEAGNYGWNAATDTFEDLMKAGVIDPAKVTRLALQNAASVAVMIITSEASVTIEKEKQEVGTNRPNTF